MGIPRAGIYTRISKWDGVGESLGVQRQEQDCRAEIERRGWAQMNTYKDDDTSAYSGKKPRPGYLRLCEDVKAGVIDAIVVWDVDRLHRSPKELEFFIELIESTGCAVVSVSGGDYDLSTSDGRFKAGIMANVARKESEDKSRRLRRKHAQLAEQGKSNGGPAAYGYRRIKEGPHKGTLVVEPDEALVVREVFERIGAGQTLTRVADELSARQPASRPWTIHSVRRTALNGRYAGIRLHNGVEVGKGEWPSIVLESEWRRCVALLKDPSRAQRRSPRRYLLTGGLIVCGACGAALRSMQHHGRGKVPVPVYICPATSQGGCGGVMITAPRVEELVAEALFARVESPAFARALEHHAGGDLKAAAQVTRLEADVHELEEAHASGAVSLREYVKFRDALQARLGDARSRLGGDVAHTTTGRYAGRTGALRTWWASGTLDERQAVLRAVIGRVVVDRTTKRGKVFDARRVRVIPVG